MAAVAAIVTRVDSDDLPGERLGPIHVPLARRRRRPRSAAVADRHRCVARTVPGKPVVGRAGGVRLAGRLLGSAGRRQDPGKRHSAGRQQPAAATASRAVAQVIHSSPWTSARPRRVTAAGRAQPCARSHAPGDAWRRIIRWRTYEHTNDIAGGWAAFEFSRLARQPAWRTALLADDAAAADQPLGDDCAQDVVGPFADHHQLSAPAEPLDGYFIVVSVAHVNLDP